VVRLIWLRAYMAISLLSIFHCQPRYCGVR